MAETARIFDRSALRVRRRRAAALGAATFLIDRVADDLAERLSTVMRHFDMAADLGTPARTVRHALAGKLGGIIAVDDVAELLAPEPGVKVVADMETLPFRDGSLDLAVSALALQFVNDLPGTLAQIRRALKPDGLLMAALLGG